MLPWQVQSDLELDVTDAGESDLPVVQRWFLDDGEGLGGGEVQPNGKFDAIVKGAHQPRQGTE